MPENPIYSFLKKNNLTQKDEQSFLKEYSDPNKAKELHSFFSNNGLTQKDDKSFYESYFKPQQQLPPAMGEKLFGKVENKPVSESTSVAPTSAVQKEQLRQLLPSMKKKAVHEVTMQRLQQKGKAPIPFSNDYVNEAIAVENELPDAQWMPSTFQHKTTDEEIKQQAVKQFSETHGEKDADVLSKLDKGDYVLKDGKVKEVGGFGDNFAQQVRGAIDNIGLWANVNASKSDNEKKYHLNEFVKSKQKEKEFAAVDFGGKAGELLGGIAPYAVAGEAMIPLMGAQNAGSNIQEIWNAPHLSDDEKIKAINQSGTDAFMIGATQGAAFGAAHTEAKGAGTLLSKYAPTAKLQYKVPQAIYNNFSNLLKTTPKDVAKVASIFGGTEMLNQVTRGREGVTPDFERVPHALLEGATLDLLMKAPKVLTSAFNTIAEAKRTGYDKANPEWFNSYNKQTQDALNDIVSAPEPVYQEAMKQLGGAVENEAVAAAKQKIETFRQYHNALPEDLPQEAKNKALHILQLKTEAVEKAQTAPEPTIAKVYENRALAYDGLLQKVLEGGKVDENKEPLLISRFEAKPIETAQPKRYEEPKGEPEQISQPIELNPNVTGEVSNGVTVIKPEEINKPTTITVKAEENVPKTKKSGVSVILPESNKKPNVVVAPQPKVKVFRGTGRNVKQGENEAIQWVAEDRRVAENYSEGGKIEEIETAIPSNPFEMPMNVIHVRGVDIANKLRTIRDKQFKDKKITREKALEISEAISDFEKKAGDELELYSTKTNKKESAASFVNALKQLGFDGLVQKESYNSESPFTSTVTGNETNTYGIFKEQAKTEASESKMPIELNPEITGEEKIWYRGVNKNNSTSGDRFYSADESVAHDYAIDKVGDKPTMTKLAKEEHPKNPLVVGSKEDLAAEIGFDESDIFTLKGDFDKKAKEYAQSKGHDAIVYESGSMDAPEMHVFEKSESKMPIEEFRNKVFELAEGNRTDLMQQYAIDVPELKTKEQERKAVADLKAGKKTVGAIALEKAINDMHEKGIISVKKGTGNAVERIDVPIEEWFANPLEPKELEALDRMDDGVVEILKNEGITADNIDNLKHLFDGFPYTADDFTAIKQYFTRKGEVNAATKEALDFGETRPEQESATAESKPVNNEKAETETENVLINEGGNPPVEPPIVESESGAGGKRKPNEKGILSHLHEAKNVPEVAKKGFEEKGLKYETSSQDEAAKVAKSILDEYGVDDAVLLAEAHKFDGDVNAIIFGEALNRLSELEQKATTPEEKLKYANQFKDVSIAYDEAARKGGRFNSAINYFYKKSPLGIQLRIKEQRDQSFADWMKRKEGQYKEVFEELSKMPEFEKLFQDKVASESGKQPSKSKQVAASLRNAAKKIREKGASDILPNWAKADLPDGTKKSSFLDEGFVKEAIATALETIAKAIEAGGNLSEIIAEQVASLKEKGFSADKKDITDWLTSQVKDDAEKAAAKKNAKEYRKLERERNRQLEKVETLKAKIEELENGVKSVKADGSKNKDVPEIESLKSQLKEATNKFNEIVSTEKRIAALETELQKLVDRKETEKSVSAKKEISAKETNLKNKIAEERKKIRQEESEANKFYGESESGEKKLDKLRDELQRIKDRKQKAKKDTPLEKVLSEQEKNIREEIKDAQAEWDAEKEKQKQSQKEYAQLESERNRQLKRVGELRDRLAELQKGQLNSGKTKTPKVDVPEIEGLKKEIEEAESALRKSIATEKRVKELESELERVQQRKAKENKPSVAKEISDKERQLKNQIELEKEEWKSEERLAKLREELFRVQNRQVKETDTSKKRELSDEEKEVAEQIKAERKAWAEEKAALKREQNEAYRKTPAYEKEVQNKILNKFRKKLNGLTDEQKAEVIRRSFKQLVENGALEYEDFKRIIADTLGYGEISPAESKRITELVNDLNAVEELGTKAQGERTKESLQKYLEAQKKAEKSATELGQIVNTKVDLTKRILSIMQLNTLGLPSLVNNPIFNIFNQSTVRFPIGVQLTALDQAIYQVGKLFGKDIKPENNILAGQGEFWKKLGAGLKQSSNQFVNGLTSRDYFQKEIYQAQIHPFTSAKELWDFSKGDVNLTKTQVADKALQATVGVPAEIVARALNIGDKPQRYAAEGAQAAVFAKNLGLKGIDYDMFLTFPKEEAYRQYKKQGLSDEAAMKKAEDIEKIIIKQGEESTFQQDNIVNDMLNGLIQKGGKPAEIFAKFNMPFVKIPLNAFWSVYNLINPEVALLQSIYYGAKAVKSKSPIDIQNSKKWLAHATTGMAMMAVAGSLAKSGIINSGNTDDTTKKEREGERTYEQQKSINITKLWAVLNGKDPNDVSNGLNVDLKWLGNVGSVLNNQALKQEEMTPEQRGKGLSFMEDIMTNAKLSTLDFMDNGVFSNTSSLYTAVKQGGSFADNYLLNLMNMGTNIVHPATLAQLSRAQLPYYSKVKADSFYEEVKNNMLARSSWLRAAMDKYPPSAINVWGEPMERKDNVAMKLFGLSRTNPDNFAQPIYQDYKKSLNTKFLPPSVKPEINHNKLNTEQARQLEQLVGQARKNLVAPYINDGATLQGFKGKYSQLSEQDKIDALNILYEQGFENGKSQFIQAYPEYKKEKATAEDKAESRKNKLFRATVKRQK